MKNMRMRLGILLLASAFAVTSAPAAIVAITNTFTGSSSIDGWFNLGEVDATIGYSNGAGPRWDYWDGDDSVAQDGATNGQAAAIVAAGGTITGDGLLADGALWFNTTDGTSGNEYIAYTLAGTMEKDEIITFNYNIFNNNDYYNETQGQLWDMTTTNQLAVAGATPQNANGWTIVKANSAVDYQPQTWHVSYVVPAAEEGHQLAIVFREWANSSHRDSYIDNISVTVGSYSHTMESKDSADFTYKWEMNSYPWDTANIDLDSNGARDWVQSSSGDFTLADGILSGTPGTNPFFRSLDGDHTLAVDYLTAIANGGYTVEFRLKYTGVGAGYMRGNFNPKESGKNFRFSIGNNFFDYYDGSVYTNIDLSDNTDAFHTFRVARYGDEVTVWRDEVKILDAASLTYAGSADGFNFGGIAGSGDPGFDLDYIRITDGAYSVVQTPEALYQDWSSSEGLTASNNAYAQDPDGDGLDNLAEYALGGSPTNGANQGIASTYEMVEEGGTNWMTYVYPRRSDYLSRGLDYYLETETDLVAAPGWTNAYYEVVGTNVTGGDFDYVTNRVSTVDESKQFLRVGIQSTP